jgi:hypothetical protein
MDDIDKYEELLSKAIKDAVKDDPESLDYFKEIKYVEPDFNKYNAGRRRYIQIRYPYLIASLLFLVLLSGTLAIFIANGSVSAAKFSAEKKLVVLENKFSGNDGDVKKYVERDAIIQEIKKPDDIVRAQDFFHGLFIPQHIPERFSFQSLVVTKSAKDVFNACYIYEDKDNQLLTLNQKTFEKDGYAVNVVGVTKKIDTDDGTIYISENPFGDGGNAVSYVRDNDSIIIAGNLGIDEMLRMLDYENK